jgi:hypothetical protein
MKNISFSEGSTTGEGDNEYNLFGKIMVIEILAKLIIYSFFSHFYVSNKFWECVDWIT